MADDNEDMYNVIADDYNEGLVNNKSHAASADRQPRKASSRSQAARTAVQPQV